MKKILFLILAAAPLMSALSVEAQPLGIAQYEVTNPVIVCTGSFLQPAAYGPVNPAGTGVIFPWYTKLDTPVANSGTDTFSFKLQGIHHIVSTWCHVNTITGTPTSVVVTLAASQDSGAGKDFVPVYTATLTSTSPNVLSYTFPTNWPYTNARWTWKAGGTESCSWYAGLLVRFKEDEEELCDYRKRPWKTRY